MKSIKNKVTQGDGGGLYIQRSTGNVTISESSFIENQS